MTSWTNITKPSGTAWTNTSKPSVPIGTPIGLLLALTRLVSSSSTSWTNITKPSGTPWTNIPKST